MAWGVEWESSFTGLGFLRVWGLGFQGLAVKVQGLGSVWGLWGVGCNSRSRLYPKPCKP